MIDGITIHFSSGPTREINLVLLVRDSLGYLSLKCLFSLWSSVLPFSIFSWFYHHTASHYYILSRKFSENMKLKRHYFSFQDSIVYSEWLFLHY